MGMDALWAFETVRFDPSTSAAELLAPASPGTAFTADERRRSTVGASVQHWAGRLAAKRAVLRLLDLEQTEDALASVEILPKPAVTCRHSAECRHGHPPAATLSGRVGRHARRAGLTAIEVSISHEQGVAAAVAFALPKEPRK
jgi:holo-[acyl-carrier protein] synthase